jgi:hypothetical protein
MARRVLAFNCRKIMPLCRKVSPLAALQNPERIALALRAIVETANIWWQGHLP